MLNSKGKYWKPNYATLDAINRDTAEMISFGIPEVPGYNDRWGRRNDRHI